MARPVVTLQERRRSLTLRRLVCRYVGRGIRVEDKSRREKRIQSGFRGRVTQSLRAQAMRLRLRRDSLHARSQPARQRAIS